MKKFMVFVCVMMMVSSAFAAEFSPTLLKLSADPVIQYDFDGSTLEIPLVVSGSPAGIVFSVYTKGMAADIPWTQNGYLGWHSVNQVDTCIYYAPLKNVQVGSTILTWDGKDQDGGVVGAGDYSYYLWAFDNQGAKDLVTTFKWPTNCNTFIDMDENGLPLANPIYYDRNNRWILGTDPADDSQLLSSAVWLDGVSIFPDGWGSRGDAFPDPSDHDYYFHQVVSGDAGQGGITRAKFVPGSMQEIDENWGVEGGTSELFTMILDGEPGVVSDGDYLFTTNSPYHQPEPGGDFFILDMDGFMVDSVDLQPWWTNTDAYAAGAQMNGGPNDIFIKDGGVYLNCHCSCLVQMVDPVRYLDSGDAADFVVWENDNGDYVLDHNFEETAEKAWICNDFNVGPYTYTVSADANAFSIVNGYDAGAVTFGLLGPDGTGMGYQSVAGETAGWKRGEVLLDGETAFDGLYLDNMQAGGAHYDADWDASADTNTYFLGHDSIMGLISSSVSVEAAAPAGFAVAQNSPNPFNPTTTISFTLATAGDVSVDVFNVAGQKVDTVANAFMNAGSQSIVWDASDFSAGVYFYTVKSGAHSQTMKMTLIK